MPRRKSGASDARAIDTHFSSNISSWPISMTDEVENSAISLSEFLDHGNRNPYELVMRATCDFPAPLRGAMIPFSTHAPTAPLRTFCSPSGCGQDTFSEMARQRLHGTAYLCVIVKVVSSLIATLLRPQDELSWRYLELSLENQFSESQERLALVPSS
jgi:hypothetical protein